VLRMFLIVIAVTSPSVAQALEFRLLKGVANFAGDLSDGTGEGMAAYGFGDREIVESALASFGLWFDVLTTSTRHHAQGFPYQDEEKLNLLVFQLMPSMCVNKWENVRSCFSLGLGTVNVNSPKDRQDYGSWHYEWSADWRFMESVSVGFVTKYVGKVEQRRSGDDAEFWFWNYALGVSYNAF